jgi:nucleotide-binding universal stress UspA family protein
MGFTVVYDEPSKEINKLTTELDADAVIVGSHAKNGDWLQLPCAKLTA